MTSQANAGRAPAWITLLLILIGATHVINGLAMYFAPSAWFFRLVPGVPETGAFNAHLVVDGGSFFIPIGVGLLIASRDPRRHIVAIGVAAGAGLLHSLLHIYSHAAGLLSSQHITTEITGIYLPTLALIVITLMLQTRPAPATIAHVEAA